MLDSIAAASESTRDCYSLTGIEDPSRVEQIWILTLGATRIKVHFADSIYFGGVAAVVAVADTPESAVASSNLRLK